MTFTIITLILAIISAIISCVIEWEVKKKDETQSDRLKRTNKNIIGRLFLTTLIIAGLIITFIKSVKEEENAYKSSEEAKTWQRRNDSLTNVIAHFTSNSARPLNPIDFQIEFSYFISLETARESFRDFDEYIHHDMSIKKYDKLIQEVYFKGWLLSFSIDEQNDQKSKPAQETQIDGKDLLINQGIISLDQVSNSDSVLCTVKLLIRKTQIDLFLTNNRDLVGYNFNLHFYYHKAVRASICFRLGAGSNFESGLYLDENSMTREGNTLNKTIDNSDFRQCECKNFYTDD